jgi:hypothetical protein
MPLYLDMAWLLQYAFLSCAAYPSISKSESIFCGYNIISKLGPLPPSLLSTAASDRHSVRRREVWTEAFAGGGYYGAYFMAPYRYDIRSPLSLSLCFSPFLCNKCARRSKVKMGRKEGKNERTKEMKFVGSETEQIKYEQ